MVMIGTVMLVILGVTFATARTVPQGDTIAYGYRGDIYLIDVDRALTYRLIHTIKNETLPVWSPDGARLAYIENNQRIQLFEMNEARSTPLLDDDILAFREPVTWSPDGTQIAATGQDVQTRRIGVYIINVATNEAELLLPDFSASELHWSPDGSALVFRSPGDVIYTIETASGALMPHTPTRGGFSPSWTEAGNHILFASERDGNYDIYMTPAHGGETQRLTNAPAMDFTSHGLSNHDEQVLFVSHRDNNPEIYMLDLNTGISNRLTHHAGSDWLPRWSPDGQRIVFVSSRDGSPNLYVMHPNGTGLRCITYTGNMDSSTLPEWRPR